MPASTARRPSVAASRLVTVALGLTEPITLEPMAKFPIVRDLMVDRPAVAGAWTARVITLFPEAFPGVLGLSLTGKALDEGRWRLETIDLRTFGEGKHRAGARHAVGGQAGPVDRVDGDVDALFAAGPPDLRAPPGASLGAR